MIKKILVFSAAWCGPCQQMKPAILKLQETYDCIEYVDIDKEPERSVQYGITSVPTIVFTHDGETIDIYRGAGTYATLKKKMEQFV